MAVGTPEGVFRTRDMRVLSDHGARWNSDFLMMFGMSFQQYVDPSQTMPDKIAIEPGVIAHDAHDVEVPMGTRRMRLPPLGLSCPRLHSRLPRMHCTSEEVGPEQKS